MWCPVDIRDYEQWSRGRTSVCACSMSGSSKGDFLLLELLTLVASRNTTPTLRLARLSVMDPSPPSGMTQEYDVFRVDFTQMDLSPNLVKPCTMNQIGEETVECSSNLIKS